MLASLSRHRKAIEIESNNIRKRHEDIYLAGNIDRHDHLKISDSEEIPAMTTMIQGGRPRQEDASVYGEVQVGDSLSPQAVMRLFDNAGLSLQREIENNSNGLHYHNGSTLSVAAVYKDTLYGTIIGNSTPLAIEVDEESKEAALLKLYTQLHQPKENNRLSGLLNLTHSLGDRSYEGDEIKHEPSILSITIKPGKKYFLLNATKGLTHQSALTDIEKIIQLLFQKRTALMEEDFFVFFKQLGEQSFSEQAKQIPEEGKSDFRKTYEEYCRKQSRAALMMTKKLLAQSQPPQNPDLELARILSATLTAVAAASGSIDNITLQVSPVIKSSDTKIRYLAVFDAHGSDGDKLSKFLAEKFHPVLTKSAAWILVYTGFQMTDAEINEYHHLIKDIKSVSLQFPQEFQALLKNQIDKKIHLHHQIENRPENKEQFLQELRLFKHFLDQALVDATDRLVELYGFVQTITESEEKETPEEAQRFIHYIRDEQKQFLARSMEHVAAQMTQEFKAGDDHPPHYLPFNTQKIKDNIQKILFADYLKEYVSSVGRSGINLFKKHEVRSNYGRWLEKKLTELISETDLARCQTELNNEKPKRGDSLKNCIFRYTAKTFPDLVEEQETIFLEYEEKGIQLEQKQFYINTALLLQRLGSQKIPPMERKALTAKADALMKHATELTSLPSLVRQTN